MSIDAEPQTPGAGARTPVAVAVADAEPEPGPSTAVPESAPSAAPPASAPATDSLSAAESLLQIAGRRSPSGSPSGSPQHDAAPEPPQPTTRSTVAPLDAAQNARHQYPQSIEAPFQPLPPVPALPLPAAGPVVLPSVSANLAHHPVLPPLGPPPFASQPSAWPAPQLPPPRLPALDWRSFPAPGGPVSAPPLGRPPAAWSMQGFNAPPPQPSYHLPQAAAYSYPPYPPTSHSPYYPPPPPGYVAAPPPPPQLAQRPAWQPYPEPRPQPQAQQPPAPAPKPPSPQPSKPAAAEAYVDPSSGHSMPLRTSCEACRSGRRGCDGQTPCARCVLKRIPCVRAIRKKAGPKGSWEREAARNRQVAEANRRLERGALEVQGFLPSNTPSPTPSPGPSMPIGSPPSASQGWFANGSNGHGPINGGYESAAQPSPHWAPVPSFPRPAWNPVGMMQAGALPIPIYSSGDGSGSEGSSY